MYVTKKGAVLIPKDVKPRRVVTAGTGPLVCLSLFPVAELDKESND